MCLICINLASLIQIKYITPTCVTTITYTLIMLYTGLVPDQTVHTCRCNIPWNTHCLRPTTFDQTSLNLKEVVGNVQRGEQLPMSFPISGMI